MSQRSANSGALDILVNNAGVMLLGPIVGAPLDEWQRMVNLNLLGCSTAPTRRCRTLIGCSRTNLVPLPTW